MTTAPSSDVSTGVIVDAPAPGVCRVRLDRPEAMNSLTSRTKDALVGHLHHIAEAPSVRAVIVTGSGRAFCVGQDLKEHLGLLHDDPKKLWATLEQHYNVLATCLATMPKPVIAAVNGVAAGAGASLCFAADFRLMADTSSFSLAFTGVGLSCDTGTSWTLPRLVGRARALELLMLPNTVRAPQALELGLATRVVGADELDNEALALATTLAAGPTVAFGAVKDALNFGAGHSLEESVVNEARLMRLTGASDDHQEAVSAFIAKTTPTFTGR
ncbi:Ras-related protein Rab-11A [Platysternon megacephalum]|uniref:Ras-related protein Rab-11A n=1 Tax=Platysternon megacephalum TaxID=55544 RepID=A0A4D9DBU2_9SAUR|nr:Ras-related protein Rab-11A [Platysternon megacephalum]